MVTKLKVFFKQDLKVTGTVGVVMLLIVVTLVVGVRWFAPHDPLKQNIEQSLLPPVFLPGGTWSHPLGTDALGRDLWARILLGMRTSLLLSVSAVMLIVVTGLLIGGLSGYLGGVVDAVLMRMTDVQMAFPFIILAVALLSLMRPSPVVLAVVMSLSTWPIYARIIRSIVMVESQADYVLVAKAMGASHGRIIFRYLLRNIVPGLAVICTLDIATMIILEAMLGFIGLGIQPPAPSLGNIIADGKAYLPLGIWWPMTMPGLAILFTLLGLNLVGDVLQRKVDPRLRRL